jgi:hypothetical protein
MSLLKQSSGLNDLDSNQVTQEEPASLSLMGGIAKPEGLPEVDFDLDALKSRKQKISQGTVVLIAVVAVAALVVYGMRFSMGDLSRNSVSSDMMKKIDQALAKANPTASTGSNQVLPVRAMFRDTDSIVRMFNADVSKSQVPIEYVQRNPFALAMETSSGNAAANAGADVTRLREQQRKLEAEFNSLKLQSVMASARIPVVIIDGQFYKEGQKVGPFTIARIHDRGVDLQAEGFQKTLSMQDQLDRRNQIRR